MTGRYRVAFHSTLVNVKRLLADPGADAVEVKVVVYALRCRVCGSPSAGAAWRSTVLRAALFPSDGFVSSGIAAEVVRLPAAGWRSIRP